MPGQMPPVSAVNAVEHSALWAISLQALAIDHHGGRRNPVAKAVSLFAPSLRDASTLRTRWQVSCKHMWQAGLQHGSIRPHGRYYEDLMIRFNKQPTRNRHVSVRMNRSIALRRCGARRSASAPYSGGLARSPRARGPTWAKSRARSLRFG